MVTPSPNKKLISEVTASLILELPTGNHEHLLQMANLQWPTCLRTVFPDNMHTFFKSLVDYLECELQHKCSPSNCGVRCSGDSV